MVVVKCATKVRASGPSHRHCRSSHQPNVSPQPTPCSRSRAQLSTSTLRINRELTRLRCCGCLLWPLARHWPPSQPSRTTRAAVATVYEPRDIGNRPPAGSGVRPSSSDVIHRQPVGAREFATRVRRACGRSVTCAQARARQCPLGFAIC